MVDEISPLPAMIILTGALYVLTRICFRGGHSTLTLCRAALLLRELKAFSASTNNVLSVSGCWEILRIACTAASHPPA